MELCDSPAPEKCMGGAYCGLRFGSTYEYRYDGSNWIEKAKHTASDGGELDMFGWSVSVDDDVRLVGAFGDDCGLDQDCGTAYVYAVLSEDDIDQQRPAPRRL